MAKPVGYLDEIPGLEQSGPVPLYTADQIRSAIERVREKHPSWRTNDPQMAVRAALDALEAELLEGE